METILIGIVASYYIYILFLISYMVLQRKKAVEAKEVRASHFKSFTGKSTEKLEVIKNHFDNQFQVPVIFFIVCLFVIQQNAVTKFTLITAATFVLSRWFHSYIHLGSNHIWKRAVSYMIGLFCVAFLFGQVLLKSYLTV